MIRSDENSTVIDKMLMLVNRFGLSHVCALEEFKNTLDKRFKPYYFPYLDTYISIDYIAYPELIENWKIEFYYRGAKDRKLKFENLFEYLLWSASYGKG